MTRLRRWSLGLGIVLLASGAGVWLDDSGQGDLLELWTYDWRMELRGPLPPLQNAPILLLAVDAESFERIRDPLVFWQPHFAEVIRAMAEARAAVIGLDLIFSDVDLVIQGLGGTADRTSSHKQALAAAILESGQLGTPVVIGYRVGGQGAQEIPLELRLSAAVASGEDNAAYFNLTTDPDDFVRRQELFQYDAEGQPAYSFAMAVARAYRQYQDLPFVGLPDKPRFMLINFRGVGHFPFISFWKALEAARTGDEAFLQQFENKIILIGVPEEDRHPTPLYDWVERSESRPMKRNPGVEIHANTIATLLEGDFIRRLGFAGRAVCTVLLVAAGTLLCFLLSPVLGISLSLVLFPVYFLIALGWFHQGTWIPVAGPLAGLLLAASTAQVAHYLLEGREKKKLRNLFKRYVDDQVIEQILEMPELALRGQRKQISILFSDIRDFTERSESLAPEDMVELLNRYFERMVEAIQSHRGTVDKFIGDGMMAVFGAPLDDPDSAYHAVQAALAMQLSLVDLNAQLEAEGKAPILIGVGIHSGEAVVGNIGSPERLEYTAIGDAVNTASRIEGLNKQFGTRILISGDTLRALNGRITPARSLSATLVKGKKEALEIYEIDPATRLAHEPTADPR